MQEARLDDLTVLFGLKIYSGPDLDFKLSQLWTKTHWQRGTGVACGELQPTQLVDIHPLLSQYKL